MSKNDPHIDKSIVTIICNLKITSFKTQLKLILANNLQNNLSTYDNKYLKYKTKYINLKNILNK